MFGLGLNELIVILVIVLIIFGPTKLPQMGKAIGESIRALKKSSEEEQTEAKKEADKSEKKDD
ncbi:MAG: twin-arginine translocase TatA/TatE family subunit [Actinomycetota bacterium]